MHETHSISPVMETANKQKNISGIEILHKRGDNVYMLIERFTIPQLNRSRRIWMYLPYDYYESTNRYPVIYMHDGQNLFDETTAFDKEWEIDETLNRLRAACIIVGIDNSEHRLREYNYNDTEKNGSGEGKAYMAFIVNTLKPFIDEHFKTKANRESTHIAGSSMGGLISLYGAMYYAETFGGAGVFSPALWLAPDFINQLSALSGQNIHLPQQYFLYGGAKEHHNLTRQLTAAADMLKTFRQNTIHLVIDPDGEHCEECWRVKFEEYYNWLAQLSVV